MPAITLDNPVVTPATDAVTYDEVWLSDLHVMAPNPNGAVGLRATIFPARTLESGEKELNKEAATVVKVDDFFADAGESELELMYALILAIKARAGV